jgi:hypothetical protein
MHEDYERLGAFYLGRLGEGTSGADGAKSLLLYQSRDLLTHGVCIGMTGSGKTGLCLNLIEEAAIDMIPVIAIDPKGDLGNLLLTFPELRPEDFKPWVSADEARRMQVSVDDLAQQKATLWKDGLEKWDQSGARIQKLKDAADFAIYTPGSSAGLPVSILGSLEAPPAEIFEDDDLLRERVGNVATSLLTLLGINADPLKSREHILVSNIVDHVWREGRSIDLLELITLIQNPPMKRVGALDLETFFPQKERNELALSLNNLLAAPGFDSWLKGMPLNIEDFLYTTEGKPRISIFSIAHLNDTERMFFVTLLLNQVLSWMRTQSGSSSLRAILYMDEIYGYFPPVANPPSKTPLLTLLKQARAYGLGILLASQNSVDLDYKGLANAGTWFIGRLQTERDKARLLDGLEGAAAENGKIVNRQDLQKLLGRLRTRLFLLNNIHEDQPVVFETRWTLSYLFGPLARGQIKSLMAHRKEVEKAVSETEVLLKPESPEASGSFPSSASSSSSSSLPTSPPSSSSLQSSSSSHSSSVSSASSAVTGGGGNPAQGSGLIKADGEIVKSDGLKETPVLDPSHQVLKATHDGELMASPAVLPGITAPHFLPTSGSLNPQERLVYKPVLYASTSVRYTDQKAKLDFTQPRFFVVDCKDSLQAISWNETRQIPASLDQLSPQPQVNSRFFIPPAPLTRESSYKAWKKEFMHWLLGSQQFYLLLSPSTKQYSNASETERDFRLRLMKAATEKRDSDVTKLKQKYAPRLTALEQKIRRAESDYEQAQIHARERQVGAAIDIGATVLGAIVGRRGSTATLRQARTAAKDISRMAGGAKTIESTQEALQSMQSQLHDLDREFRDELRQVEQKYNPSAETLEPVGFAPKQTNVSINAFVPVWAPYALLSDGGLRELWR